MQQLLRQTSKLIATAGLLALAACADSTNPGNGGGGGGGTGPTAPAAVVTSQLSLSSAKISWTKVTGATSYTLQRADGASTTFNAIGGTLTDTTYTDAGLTAGVAYSYRVSATSAAGTSAFSPSGSITLGLKQRVVSGNITAAQTWTADSVYVLSGYIKIQNGITLTIQPGTKIVGDTTVVGSSLWVLRGARLVAEGTASSPIVFTSQRATGNRRPGDWGGIIMVGNGIINRTGSSILTEGGAAGVAENYAGGTDNNDNSGSLKYVRIEFAGYDVSNGAGQELNSLSMYAVGRGTKLEYVESLAGLDDSFEWWGGAVDARYLVSYESGDDHFDWTEGFQGRNQFLIALQTQRSLPAPGTGVYSSDPRGFEGDGCDPAVAGCTVTATGASTPYSNPVFANFTMVGTGQLAGIPADGNGGVWRRGTGGYVLNGILARWKGIGLNFRDAWTDTLFVQRDSLNVVNILMAQNGFNYDTVGAGFAQRAQFGADTLTHKVYASSVLVDTLLGISTNPAGLQWKPKAGSPANTGGGTVPAAKVTGYQYTGGWVNTTYLGAVDPAATTLWYSGWTNYAIN